MPTITPNGGNFVGTQTVNIACTTENATIHYTTDGTDPKTSTTAVTTPLSFTISNTTTVRAYATANNLEDSEEAQATFTKVEPLANIAALTANTEAGTYYVTLTNAVVTFVNSSNAYIQDASGAVQLHKSGHGLTAGDVLSGTATVTYALYNGNPQITDLSGMTPVSGTAPEPTSVVQSDWNYTFNNVLSQYFKVTGATITTTDNKYYVSLGGESIQLYKSGTAITSLDLTRTYTIIGFPTIYVSGTTTKKELTIYEDPTAEATADPTITVNPTAAAAFTYVVDNGPSDYQVFELGGTNLTDDITVSVEQNGNFVISDDVTYGYTSLTLSDGDMFMVRMKEGLAVGSYSGTITLSSTGANDVTINLTGTVTAPVGPHVTWDLSAASYVTNPEPTEELIQWTSTCATMKNEKGTGTKVNNYIPTAQNSTRFYNGNHLTITPAPGYTINSVVFTATTNGYATALKNSTWTNATASMETGDNIKDVTVTPTDGTIDISAVISATCGFTAVTVYYTEPAATAPVWSALPTPTINTGESYSLNLSELVTGHPVPTIALSTTVSTSLYEFENGLLEFQPTTVGTYTFIFTATNSEGSAQATLTVTATAPQASIAVTPTTVNAPVAETDGTLAVTYEYVEASIADIVFFESDGVTTATYDHTWIQADLDAENNYNVYYLISANTGDARTAYFKVYGLDADANDVYSNLVTINQAAYVAPVAGSWELTDLADLTPADVFVIVGNNAYAMSNDNGTTHPLAVDITISGNTLSGVINTNIQWNLIGNATDGYTFYPAGDANNYLYCGTTAATGSNDNIKVGTGTTGRNVFKLGTKDSNYYLITSDSYENRYVCLYNSTDWRGYIESSIITNNKNITNTTFYKKVTDDVSYSKDIAAYTNTTEEPANGYVLIASPVASVTPTVDNGFLKNTYDLYAFDQSANGAEWRNYKANNFDLVSGKGYLYANSALTSLTFEGQPYNGNGVVVLSYDATATLAGWNLIGNPYASSANLDKPYYRLNSDGSALQTETESSAVAAMEGVFVEASAADQTATFTASSKGRNQSIATVNLMVSDSRGIINDNAIIRFDNGETLEKFVLNENSAKLYFTENDQDYAIVRSNNEDAMPVYFKAAENGTYTISVNTENLEANYLHLIDNITGMDVDLLANPSYSFEANTSDYTSRFRLVFSANNTAENNNDSFAFISNGQIIITGTTGNETIQVIDALGRILVSTNATQRVATENMTPGVYVVRIINGNEVKTQKIAVK